MSADARWGDGTPKDIVLFLCQRNILLWVCVGRYLKHLQALSHRNSNSVAMIEQLKKPKSRTLLISFRLVTRSQTALSHRPTSTQTGRARSPTGPVMRWMLTHTKLPAGLIFHCPVIACGEIKARIIEKKFGHGFQQCLKIPSVIIILSRKVLKISQPQLKVSEGQEGYWRTDEPLWEENCTVYLLWCILCILDIPTGRTKPTLAPGGLDPALFLMLGYLMAIWSHLSRYWLPVCPLDIAPPPIYFLSCSGFLAILVGSPKAS